jgi:hypothetical protein
MYTKGIQLYFPQRGIKVKNLQKGEFYSFFHKGKSNLISQIGIQVNFPHKGTKLNISMKGNLGIMFPKGEIYSFF